MRDTIILTFNCSDYMALPFIKRGYKIQMVDPAFGMTSNDGTVIRLSMTLLEALQANVLRFDRMCTYWRLPDLYRCGCVRHKALGEQSKRRPILPSKGCNTRRAAPNRMSTFRRALVHGKPSIGVFIHFRKTGPYIPSA